MSGPRVSVHVASYNYEQYVGQAIESVLGQTLEDLECIIVDDSSTDRSWEIVQRYASDPRVRLIRHATNRGHLATYETALAACGGRYVVCVSADDRAIDPDALRLQADALDGDERLGLVFTDFDVIDGSGARIARRRIDLPERIQGREAFRRFLFENFIVHSGTMVRRRCLEELGTYDHRFFHGADRELWLRISARYDLAHVRRPLWAYRIHARNMHRTHGYEDSLRETTELIDTAMAYAPFDDAGLRDRAVAHNHVTRASVWLRAADVRRATSDLGAALHLHPPSVLRADLVRGLIRGALSFARLSRRAS